MLKILKFHYNLFPAHITILHRISFSKEAIYKTVLKKLYSGKVSWWILICVTLFNVKIQIKRVTHFKFQHETFPPYNFFKMCNQFALQVTLTHNRIEKDVSRNYMAMAHIVFV
jgi:hypothetical protein